MALKVAKTGSDGTAYVYEDKNEDKREGRAADFKKLYAELVEERQDSLKETLEEMNERKKELKDLQKMVKFTETVRRIMPDGSIMISEYEEGRLVSRQKRPPHLKAVPDESAPPKMAPDGTELTAQREMKLVPKISVFDNML